MDDHDDLRFGIAEAQSDFPEIRLWYVVQRKNKVENASFNIPIAICGLSVGFCPAENATEKCERNGSSKSHFDHPLVRRLRILDGFDFEGDAEAAGNA